MTADARTRRLRALIEQMLLPRRDGEYQGGAEARHFYARELEAVLDTEGDRPEPDDANELRTVVRDMRLSAIDRLCADVPKLWPRLSARTFAAVVGALGEISIIEAREALSRADTEGA
jgi:hypothetical protein